MEKIKINVHIVKGYNIPIRAKSLPQKEIDEKKLDYIGYKPTSNNYGQMLGNSMNQSANNSNPFQYNNNLSKNQSFSVGINGSMGMGMGMGMGFGPMGTMGANPNFNNQMFNPSNPNMSAYQNNPMGENKDILFNIQKLSYLEESRVNSFIEVKIVYYD
jgi:hypothetical protein